MKNKLMLLVIALIMIVSFVSCEGDIFQSISNFMGGTSTNVLIDGEIISVPTANINELDATLGGTTDDPVTPEQVAAVRESVENILESEGETEAAKTLLAEPVEEGEIPDEVAEAMGDLEDELGLEEGDLDIEDKGDLAAAILLADLMKKRDALGADPTPEEKEELIQEARVAIEFVKKVSSIGDIDVTTALTDLLESMMDDRAMRQLVSRVEAPSGMSKEDLIAIVKPLFNMYFKVIDTDNNGIASPAEVSAISRQYAFMRSGYESLALGLPDTPSSDYETKLSDIVNYISSVIISSNNALIPVDIRLGNISPYPATTFSVILNLVKAYVDSGITEMPTGDEWYFIDESVYDLWTNTLLDYLTVGDKYITIFTTVKRLSYAVPRNGFISGQIDEITAELTTLIEGEE